jgi:predicted nucleic acid-binding protein
MNLIDIVDGGAVFIDANIFIYAVERRSLQCRQLLERCDREAVRGVSSIIVLAEVCHRRMMNEAKEAGTLSGSNISRLLAQRPGLVKKLSTYAENICALLDSTILFESVSPHDFQMALEIQKQHGLLTNDSLNLSVAKRLGLQSIATADSNFDAVRGLNIYRPTDLLAP